MSHVKAGGATRQASPRPGKRRGVKKFGGQTVKVGQIIIRQVGTRTRAGVGVKSLVSKKSRWSSKRRRPRVC